MSVITLLILVDMISIIMVSNILREHVTYNLVRVPLGTNASHAGHRWVYFRFMSQKKES